MGRCLNLSQGGEYALSALARLAMGHPAPASVEALAKLQRIPRTFLSKMLGRCAKAGIVRAKTGPAGGMSLLRDPERVSILEIIEACEGDLRRSRCVFYVERSCDGPACPVYCPLRRKEDNLRQEMGKTTLAEMARSLQDHPLAQGGRAWTRRESS